MPDSNPLQDRELLPDDSAGWPASPALWSGSLLSVGVLYLVLALWTAEARRPEVDEAWFASPAFTLITRGFMGTRVIEEANTLPGGRSFRGINSHTYWILPLHPLVQVAWYKAFGFSLRSLRALSALWGLIGLVSWYVIVRRISGSPGVATFAVVLLGLDFVYLRSAAHGRMDMMTLALGSAAVASYLSLRARSLTGAFFVASGLSAAACLTHPNGGLWLVTLILIAVWMDRRHIRIRHVLIGVVPYVAAVGAWSWYILQAPADFIAQSVGQTHGRLWTLSAPWAALKAEIVHRYLGLEGRGPHFLKGVPALVYLFGPFVGLFVSTVRARPEYRALLTGLAVACTYLWLFEGTKLYLYAVHVVPTGIALTTMAVASWRRDVRRLRWAALGATGLCALSLSGVAYVLWQNDLDTTYGPAARFMSERVDAATVVMGSAELFFYPGLQERVLDDVFLGFQTGRRADYIVVEGHYRQAFAAFRDAAPAVYQYVSTLLAQEYRLVYDRGGYLIYQKK